MGSVNDSPVDDDDLDVRAFARAFTSLLEWAQEIGQSGGDGGELARTRLHEHVPDVGERSVVSRTWAAFEHVNLQGALEAWAAQDGRTVEVVGLRSAHPGFPVELADLVSSGGGRPPVRTGAPDVVDLPSGPDRSRACWRLVMLLVTDERGPHALVVRVDEQRGTPRLAVEVAGLPTEVAQEVLAEVEALRDRLNVYRGQTIELTQGDFGSSGVTFPTLTPTAREDVVLPEAVLARLERHTLGIAARRDALRAAGQHLKRGVLLHGPPGTGKTHTVRYLTQALEGATVVLLSGRSMNLVGAVTELARELAPSVVVLEDVDLVAEDRSFGTGPSPVLFELLDAMDGAAADADLLFLLTTNRADLLESALAARPGRVDVAVEIALPDADARRRLLQVYARGVPLELDESEREDVVARTEGVTASFVKELVRRSVLEALVAGGDGAPLTVVDAAHVGRALDDLLDAAQGVTRALLGVREGADGDDEGGTDGGQGPVRPAGGHPGRSGWFAYAPGRTRPLS